MFIVLAVLLEIITGRRAVDDTREIGKHTLINWVKYSMPIELLIFGKLQVI